MATNSNGGLNMDYYPLRPIESMTLAELQAAIPKGDAGGIVLGNLIVNGTDLNTITADGVYRLSATTGINMPPIGYGILYVNNVDNGPLGSRVTHTFYPGTTGTAGRYVAVRGYAGGIWNAWRVLPTARTDSTAGRAIYQWDESNSRDQLVYGDTGQRNMGTLTNAAYFDNTGVRNLYVRRVGYDVSITGQLGCVTNGASGQTSITLPTGFRCMPGGSESTILQIRGSSSALCRANISGGTGAINLYSLGGSPIPGVDAGDVFNVTINFMTLDAWPTTLPGVALGTIPNL